MTAFRDSDEQEQVMALFHALSNPVGILLLEGIAAGRTTPTMARKALELMQAAALHNSDRHAARDALARLDTAQADAVPRHVAQDGGPR